MNGIEKVNIEIINVSFFQKPELVVPPPPSQPSSSCKLAQKNDHVNTVKQSLHLELMRFCGK